MWEESIHAVVVSVKTKVCVVGKSRAWVGSSWWLDDEEKRNKPKEERKNEIFNGLSASHRQIAIATQPMPKEAHKRLL